MITSKERAILKRIISSQSCVFQVGKEGLNKNNIEGIEQALVSRELIKINILQNCDAIPKILAEELKQKLSCEIVGVVGRKIIIYKLNPKNKKHILDA